MTSPQQSTVNLLTQPSPVNILTPTAVNELTRASTGGSAPLSVVSSIRTLSDVQMMSPSNSSMVTSSMMRSSGSSLLRNSRGSGPMTALQTAVSTPVANAAPAVKAAVRVLVVEDSPPNRKLLCSLLTRLGCKVTAAENGEECVNLMKPALTLSPVRRATINRSQLGSSFASRAAAMTDDVVAAAAAGAAPSASAVASASATASSSSLASHNFVMDFPPMHGVEPGKHSIMDQMIPFDIILMDNSMPVMDGVTATRLLRSSGISIPIVGVTGNTLEEDLLAFMDAGATLILGKPVSVAKLEKVLRDYTSFGQGGSTAPGRRVAAARSPSPAPGVGRSPSPAFLSPTAATTGSSSVSGRAPGATGSAATPSLAFSYSGASGSSSSAAAVGASTPV